MPFQVICVMEDLRGILQKLLKKELSLEQAERCLKTDFIEKVGNFANLDLHRAARTGIPEIIFAETKSLPVMLEITKKFIEKSNYALVTRVTNEQMVALEKSFKYAPDLLFKSDINSRIAVIQKRTFQIPRTGGLVGIITAGSSDIPIAEEANVVCEYMGCTTLTAYDVGVAGIHRIFEPLKDMIEKHVDSIIVCAGMEGTLPGIVASLVDVVVIGVPTSSGYGHGGRGEGALTTMLQSCVPGLVVVNIDNGVGAGASASIIANKMATLRVAGK
ncbi:MAG: 1-(5-phosphoribosyl)-5-amino-4-imidazole-carboxylate (AIR) carboxylase [Promethearchaeota archaeon CR_4]|nr:MAG: 1-(5-phosphoribosyl)-5-amino-4-imidazole-carboxylate (AIR) carboxylase [Candidatus Lokiarchaeota archaeon CR_4]